MNDTASSNVIIYTTRYCGYCVRAKALLSSKNIAFTEVPVDGDREARVELARRSGQHTVPQIWIGDTHVGGCDELMALEAKGQLDRLLQLG